MTITNPFEAQLPVVNPHLVPNEHGAHGGSLDKEFQDTIANPEQAGEIQQANLKPKGWYGTSEDYRPTFFTQVNTDEDGSRTGVAGSRNMGVLLARVSQKYKGEVYTAIIRVELSPDARAKREWVNGEFSHFSPTKHDSATRMYGEAQAMFKGQHGQYAGSITQLLEFLADTGFKANCMVRDDGSMLPFQLAPQGRTRRG